MKGLAIILIVCLLLAMFPMQSAVAQVPTGEIVFNREGGIYIMSADGSHVRQVTDYGLWPAWSPDGTRIAFGRWGPTWCDLFVMFADGSADTAVVSYWDDDEYQYTHPAWSADGRELIYQDDDGGWKELDPSPDGNKLAYSEYGDIYVNVADNSVNLTNDPADDREPAWSPDSTKIAFASNRGGNYDIYLINADGSGLKRLMDNQADDREPVWSPDGTQLAFTRIMANSQGDIFVMNVNGGNQTNITNHPNDDSHPDWKPASQMNVHRVVLVSSSTGGQVNGIRFNDEDILAYDLSTGAWQMYFDGSDVGLGANDVNALGVLWNGDLLLSLNAPHSVSGLGKVDDSDIINFVPATLGQTTTGTFDIYFAGADWDLTTNDEDIDAIGITGGNQLVVSTLGNYKIGAEYSDGITGKDKDLLIFQPWSIVDPYLVGSEIGLTQPSEDISDVWFDNADLYLSTIGAFAVPGVEGDGADIFIMGSDTFRPFWDGSAHGFGGEVIDAFDIIYATELPVTAAGVDAAEAEESDDTIDDDVSEEANGETLSYQSFLPLIR